MVDDDEMKTGNHAGLEFHGRAIEPGVTSDATKAAERINRTIGYRFLVVAWLVMSFLTYARFRMEGSFHENVLVGVLEFSTVYIPWLFLPPVLCRLERRFTVLAPFRARRALAFLVLGVPVSYATAMIAQNTLPLLLWLLGLGNATYPFVSRPRVTEMELQFALYLVTLGGSAFLRHLAQLRMMEQQTAELAIQKAELEGALKQAELETLRLRLNPHFLFNCLQNISALAADDAKTASTMLARLGDLLRVALRGDYQTEITLADEIHLTQAYLSIEQVRFGDRLSVLFEMDAAAERALVPSLLLQPLVENAIKHGLSEMDTGGIIWIRGAHDDLSLTLSIRDNGRGFTSSEENRLFGGVGLGATRERLTRIYGTQHTFLIKALPEGGTEVSISLPLRWGATTNPNYDKIPQRFAR
jgi:two-component system LytT family sensor kinase